MKEGDVFRTRVIKTLGRDAKGAMRSEVTYRPPKGTDFVVILLAVAPHAEPLNLDTMLRENNLTLIEPRTTAEG